ncbi:MAG: NfeD family protein [Comamonas sp.]|jgi:membrane protein implicated in regulation of membrane protease activity|nr:NfeD family protein [Comamonas sp.]
MEISTVWWLLTGLAVVAELLTGTLYLLMVAIGMAAAAIAAHLGASEVAQILIAAIVGAATVLACYMRQKRRGSLLSGERDQDMHLDIGEQLEIEHWDADRTTQVRYRGAPWTATLLGQHPALPGAYRVVRLEGNRLLVEPAGPAAH